MSKKLKSVKWFSEWTKCFVHIKRCPHRYWGLILSYFKATDTVIWFSNRMQWKCLVCLLMNYEFICGWKFDQYYWWASKNYSLFNIWIWKSLSSKVEFIDVHASTPAKEERQQEERKMFRLENEDDWIRIHFSNVYQKHWNNKLTKHVWSQTEKRFRWK